jgi:hypothetical protein
MYKFIIHMHKVYEVPLEIIEKTFEDIDFVNQYLQTAFQRFRIGIVLLCQSRYLQTSLNCYSFTN